MQEAVKVDTENKFVKCPCCGKQTMPKNAQIDSATIETFMSCVLAGEPFTNRYKLFNGKIVVICKEPTQAQTFLLSDIATNISMIEDQKIRLAVQNVMYYISGLFPIKQIYIKASELGQDKMFDVRSICMQILKQLSSTPAITQEKLDQLKAILSDPKKVGTLPNQILLDVVNKHTTVTRNLYSAGFDSVFYTGIPHAE